MRIYDICMESWRFVRIQRDFTALAFVPEDRVV